VAGEPNDGFWAPVKEFGTHVAVGMAIFLIVAAAAVLLDLLVRVLVEWNVSEVILGGLRTAEYALFGLDLILLLVFMARLAYRTLRVLW
jgi:hypothetical protein